MVNFAEKAQKMEDITFTSLLPLLSTELDKSRAQLQYKTHSQAVFWKDPRASSEKASTILSSHMY